MRLCSAQLRRSRTLRWDNERAADMEELGQAVRGLSIVNKGSAAEAEFV